MPFFPYPFPICCFRPVDWETTHDSTVKWQFGTISVYCIFIDNLLSITQLEGTRNVNINKTKPYLSGAYNPVEVKVDGGDGQ